MSDINARRYYRVAYQRLDDGAALLDISRPRAAIYLTGYAVEPGPGDPEDAEAFLAAANSILSWANGRM